MTEFKSLLISIHNEIETDELELMKYYCKAYDIGAGILEQIKRPIQLFEALEKRALLTAEKKDVLADLLEKAGRRDLKHKLLGTKEPEDVRPRSRDDCQRDGVAIEGAEAQNVQGPAKKIGEEKKGGKRKGPLETMPGDMRMDIPQLELANPKITAKPKKDEKDRSPQVVADGLVVTDGLVVADGLEEIEPEHMYARPNQETKPPVVQRLGHILDPDRYFVVKQIGSGSCGKVYLCETKSDAKRSYAVKQVELGMNNKETQKQVKCLKKEIEILKKLRHPYIVALYHSEDTAQTISIFMEYLSGGSICDYVNTNGKIEERLVRKYTFQILKGCEYLHGNDVIHRDIKGGNVLIDSYGNIRLADFGIAKDLQDLLTSTGMTTKGSIYWCSPEHFGEGSPTYAFDIWSVGCTVIEMLTTKPPNFGLRYATIVNKILQRNVHPPEHLSPLAKEFIEMCFKVNEERPTATELLNNDFPTETPNTSDENET